MDSLLPVQNPKPLAETIPKLKPVNEAHKRREWAHEINVNQPFDNFHELVPEMAMQVSRNNSNSILAMFTEAFLSFLSSWTPSKSMRCITWRWVTLCL